MKLKIPMGGNKRERERKKQKEKYEMDESLKLNERFERERSDVHGLTPQLSCCEMHSTVWSRHFVSFDENADLERCAIRRLRASVSLATPVGESFEETSGKQIADVSAYTREPHEKTKTSTSPFSFSLSSFRFFFFFFFLFSFLSSRVCLFAFISRNAMHVHL